MKLEIFNLIYYFSTCKDPRRDAWKDPIVTEPNKDDKSTERRNSSERLMTTGDGMYKFAF